MIKQKSSAYSHLLYMHTKQEPKSDEPLHASGSVKVLPESMCTLPRQTLRSWKHYSTSSTQQRPKSSSLRTDGIFLACLRPANLGLASWLRFIHSMSFRKLQGFVSILQFGIPLQRSPVGPTLVGASAAWTSHPMLQQNNTEKCCVQTCLYASYIT